MTNIKNSLVEQIQQVKTFQQEMFAAQEKFNLVYNHLENSTKSLMERTLAEYDLDNDRVQMYFTLISNHKDGWDPHFYISYLHDAGKGLFLYTDHFWINISGNWIKHKGMPYQREVQFQNLDMDAKNPSYINLNDVNSVCATLTEKTGCRVEFTKYIVCQRHARSGNKIPQTINDLLSMHDGSAVVAQGEKFHKGSTGREIGEPWAILRTRKSHFVIYYSTNGHGFGYDTNVMPDKSTRDFLNWLGDDKSHIPTNVYKPLTERNY